MIVQERKIREIKSTKRLNGTLCIAEIQEREIREIKSTKRPSAMQRSMAV